jgi:triosephosphate isomerase
MKTQKIIVGNWKMNPESSKKALEVFTGIEKGLTKVNAKKVTAIVCPSYLHIGTVKAKSKGRALIGAQNFYPELKGSFTGEVSPVMLKDMGVSHVILGHSERRKMGESDESVNKKVLLALKNKITPIICIGETTRDDDGAYLAVIKDQILHALEGVTRPQLNSIIIAYEPVWAIGATVAMNAHDVHQMMIFIKKVLLDQYKMKSFSATPVLYGGAVDPTNAHGILTEGEADGLLVGRQSLEAASFLEIIGYANAL